MASEHCEFYETWYKRVWMGVTEIQTSVGVQVPALYQFCHTDLMLMCCVVIDNLKNKVITINTVQIL